MKDSAPPQAVRGSRLPLGKLADIRAGVTFREPDSLRPVPGGVLRLIRAGDLTDNGQIRPSTEVPTLAPSEPISPELVLRPGDVLFPARGQRTLAAVYRGEPPAPVIVGTQFFILRPDATRLDPDFLAWCFFLPEAQRHFGARRGASTVAFLTRGDLAEFPVPVPPLGAQRRVARLCALLGRERDLTERLLDRRRLLVQTRLSQTL